MMKRRTVRLAVALASTALAVPAWADGGCDNGICRYELSIGEMFSQVDKLVAEHRFDDAKPLLEALSKSGQMPLEAGFLSGYVAIETGNVDEAIRQFRHVLDRDPGQTRVRLELARALMLKGKDGAADHHFRLAAQDNNLPPEILQTIKSSRGILRDRKPYSFSMNVGVAPDSNINNGTNSETVDIVFGGGTIPLTLDPQARARSGIGQTGSFAGSYRLALGGAARLLVETDSSLVNYKGKAADDLNAQIAVGPEIRFSDDTSLSVQAIGGQRWYGGKVATRTMGLRTSIQHNLGEASRIGLSLDARRNASSLNSAYTGWQLNAYATYERVIARSMIASASVFARRESLNSASYSGNEFGANVGIGGELPLGINAGLSAGASHATYDAPLFLFSSDVRKDWRFSARAYAGLRSLRFIGFSPSITYSYSTTLSSLTLYDSKRSRFQFNLARYF
jgi:outer membrane protein